MGEYYYDYLQGLKDVGLTEIAIFTSVEAYTKYGSWGIKESLDQNPKTAYKH